MKRPSPARIRFGEKLRKLREEKNMTQKEVAAIIGRTNRSVSNYENGMNYPGPECIEALAELFGVTPEYLNGASEGRQQIVLSETETRMIRGFRRQPDQIKARIYATSLEGTEYASGSEFMELMRNYLKSIVEG